MTVSGFTIARASDHLDQKRESKSQNARSIGTSRGRLFSSEHRELLAQRKVLSDQVRTRAKGADERAHNCCEKPEHTASLLKARVVVSGDSCRETR